MEKKWELYHLKLQSNKMEAILRGDIYHRESVVFPKKEPAFFSEVLRFFKNQNRDTEIVNIEYKNSNTFSEEKTNTEMLTITDRIVYLDKSLNIFSNWYSYQSVMAPVTFYSPIHRSSYSKEILVDNNEEVRSFLDTHSEFTKKLTDIKYIVKAHFLKEDFQLEVRNDPEGDQEEQILFLYIITKRDPREALIILDKVDEEIFEDLNVDPLILNTNLRFVS